MSIVIISIVTIFLLFLYQRHVPVIGIVKLDLSYLSCFEEDVVIVDTRDYQTSFRGASDNTYCLPLPYLKRHFRDLPNKKVVIIASNNVERNLSARILQRKGIRIVGYCLAKKNERSNKNEIRYSGCK
ncbi:rhodanese-like domain-containing protein [Virgibacillus sp. DJP39]|uniref:rhodanese-like domain-containing protein n=1 Tax=Virgibacillus sp. DJP39 TaxID=3409790 RepID=UPI003BB71965